MFRSMLLVPCALLGTALLLPAQWVEVGDAGQLLPSAQIPVGVGPLVTITGAYGGGEADMYQIQIVSPALFSATTVGGSVGDTQLFLFDENGRGVTFNDDSAATVQSTITGVNVPVPGRYYLAISGYNHDAASPAGFIWLNGPFGLERAPDGPGRGGPLTGWAGGSGAAAYVITLAGVAFPGPQLLLPDNHYLGKSATQAQASGSINWWGGATAVGRRFMVLYEASNFTGVNGVTGGIGITNLRFRGEDTEHNVGGQTYTGVVVNVYKTTLTTVTYSGVAFAANIIPAAPNTTTMIGTVAIPVLTVSRSLGTAPNNYCIDINFVPPVPYNPVFDAAGEVNFMVEVNYLAAAAAPDLQASTMMQMQDTAGGVAFIRGRGSYGAPSGVAASTNSTIPPVIGVEFSGPGGFAQPIPATNERYGAACGGSPSAFYQLFPHDNRFDLADPSQTDGLSGLTLTPNVYPAPTFYTVTGGAAPVDLVNGLLPAPITSGDDDTMLHMLPPATTFEYPGGPAGGTPSMRPATNGYVIVDPASVEGGVAPLPGNFGSDYSPTVAEFLGSTPVNLAKFAPFWSDFSPNKNAPPLVGADPLAGLHAANWMAGTEVLITWYRVGRYNSVAQAFQEEHTMQASFNWMTGVVQFRYGPMNEIQGDTFSGTTAGITGFSRGNILGIPSVNPQSRDLSIERPFSTSIEGATGNLGMVSASVPVVGGPLYMGRAFPGQTITWNASGVPVGALLGVQFVDIAAARPGLAIPGIVAPGCMLSTSPGALLWEVTVFPPAAPVGAVPLLIPPGFSGFEIFSQYVLLDGLFLGPPLITAASNAVKNRIGLQ
ncbi:MAG TPA: hypothetical protein VFD82_16945 [Planctomycetota bacterium]|nr:hypothetical protein [Planctomycetota bacterium]